MIRPFISLALFPCLSFGADVRISIPDTSQMTIFVEDCSLVMEEGSAYVIDTKNFSRKSVIIPDKGDEIRELSFKVINGFTPSAKVIGGPGYRALTITLGTAERTVMFRIGSMEDQWTDDQKALRDKVREIKAQAAR
jgi:hypothetical protein